MKQLVNTSTLERTIRSGLSGTGCADSDNGIRSKRRQVGSATNKTATRRNGDNLIGDNSVISATDKVKNGEKAARQNGDNDRRRGGKREKEEGRGGKKKNH